MRGKRLPVVVAGAVLLTLFSGGLAEAKGPVADQPEFIFQDVKLAPFEDSKTYIVVGERVPDGCAYTYPDFTVPADVDRWQIRDVGIDPKRCMKLVEEGVPTVEEVSDADSSLTQVIDASSSLPIGSSQAPSAVTSVASGFAHAWYEDLPGWDVTSDKTWISWTYNGSCATAGSSSAEWSWIAGTGWRLVSGTNGGTHSLTCSRYFADTWATMTNTDFPLCPWATFFTYYYHVRAYGWYNGTLTGSRSDYLVTDGLCLPLFEHFEYIKTG